MVSAPTSDGPPAGVRPDIAASWRRTALAGVDEGGRFDRLLPSEVDPHGSLLVGAGPVLDELEAGLVGTGCSTLLGDRECRVVRRWFDDPVTEAGFDALHIGLGASILEEYVGTNALGTALETRRPVTIHGAEHYVEALRRFSCYGHPIRHPLTHRIEGVLDISTVGETASPLLPPLIARAVRDIESRLLGGSRVSERHLLAAFQAAGHRGSAIVAIGEDIVMTNQPAADLLTPGDVALLRVLAEEPPRGDQTTLRLRLESGRTAAVTISRVAGARRGVLLRFTERPTGPHLVPAAFPASRPEPVAPPCLVAGPPGSGRTSRALALATPPVKLLRAATALLEGEAAWARELDRAMRRREGSVCVDGIDLLCDELLAVVLDALERRPRPRLVMVSGPVSDLTGRAAALAGAATVREELLPLAARRGQIPDLAAAMLREVAADRPVHLAPSAVRALSAHAWPGNLRELRSVVAQAAGSRAAGAITVADLPAAYRSPVPGRPLTALDQAERDVILTALRAADGNKVRAARELGLSRTTLYARLRQLRITAY